MLKTLSLAAYVVAVLSVLVGIKNVYGAFQRFDGNSNQFAGYVVGSFLIPLFLFGFAHWLGQKAESRRRGG